MLNCGVFALHRDAPHWDAWARILSRVLQRTQFFFVEQMALNYVIFAEHLPVNFLPAYCNWMPGDAAPAFDAERGLFVEPYAPHRGDRRHASRRPRAENSYLPAQPTGRRDCRNIAALQREPGVVRPMSTKTLRSSASANVERAQPVCRCPVACGRAVVAPCFRCRVRCRGLAAAEPLVALSPARPDPTVRRSPMPMAAPIGRRDILTSSVAPFALIGSPTSNGGSARSAALT